jgi:NADP-dependent 3-hydroxy acid dehydrogenase YdfG
MQTQVGRVAVITGAASGIGRGLAEQGAKKGLRLVLADIDAVGLQALGAELRASGAELVTQVTDVSDPAQLDALREVALEQFGGVDLLFNNAGVMQTGLSWEIEPAQWQRMLNINLVGVLNGIRSFVPLLLKQNRPATVINTASLAGLICSPFMAPYTLTKQAVVALSETLQYELSMLAAPVKVAVICPGPVASAIMGSDQTPEAASGFSQLLDASIRDGMQPRELADLVYEALDQDRFWIFPHRSFKPALESRLRCILDETTPVFQMAQMAENDHAH